MYKFQNEQARNSFEVVLFLNHKLNSSHASSNKRMGRPRTRLLGLWISQPSPLCGFFVLEKMESPVGLLSFDMGSVPTGSVMSWEIGRWLNGKVNPFWRKKQEHVGLSFQFEVDRSCGCNSVCSYALKSLHTCSTLSNIFCIQFLNSLCF